MLAPAEALLARTLNLGGFGLAEVALSVQVPANLKRFIGLMLLIQATQLLAGLARDILAVIAAADRETISRQPRASDGEANALHVGPGVSPASY